MAQDIPHLDNTIVQLPSDIREDLAERGKNDLMFFDKGILGFKDMTVGCHGPMCAFADQNEKQFKLILVPRDHLKTSTFTIGGTMQRVVRDPESRNLIANESATNAQRMLRAIRQHAESNRVFRALYSDIIPKHTSKTRWNDEELQFNRQGHYPEPSIDSIGMTGAVTSRHYTHITYDDPISEEAVKSDKVMQDTINRMSTALDLLTDPAHDSIWLVGTRWALHDVYSVWMKIFGDQLGRFIRSAIEDGDPIWPERFTLEVLAIKRQILGEYKFSCLMMNNPRNEELQDMNVKDLRFWHWANDETVVVLMDQQGNELRRVPLEKLDITTTVDLAAAEKIADDRNCITTVGITPWNECIILDSWAKRCTPLTVLEYLFEIKKRFSPRAFGIEDVAYQKAFKYFVKQQCEQRGVYMNIVPLKAVGKKEVRIRGLQPLLATGRIYAHPTQHVLRSELADFPLGEHDDTIDGLSMHLQLFRGQMSPDRWDKYKKAEQSLLRRLIKPRQVKAVKPWEHPISGSSWEEEDEDDGLLIAAPPIVDFTIQ
jgi:hypothetical protein